MVFGGYGASWIFHDGGVYYTETSPLICRTNQWTFFHTTGTSVMKDLILCYLPIFIEIYWLDYDKIIEIFASKYQRRMLLKRLTLEKHVKPT